MSTITTFMPQARPRPVKEPGLNYLNVAFGVRAFCLIFSP